MLPEDVAVSPLPCVGRPIRYHIYKIFKFSENLEKWRFLRVFFQLGPVLGQKGEQKGVGDFFFRI